MAKLESHEFSQAHRKCRKRMIEAAFCDELPRHEALAIAAYVVGQILHFQDIPAELAQEIVIGNILKGGAAAKRAMKDAA